jgi:hypothetical protein
MIAESVEMGPFLAIGPSSGDGDYPTPEFASPELNASALGLRVALIAVQQTCEQKMIDQQTARLHGFLSQMRDRCLQAVDRLQADVFSLPAGKERDRIRGMRRGRMEFSRWLKNAINRLIEDDEAATAGAAFRECFVRLDSLTAETKESIPVAQEPERFLPSFDDSFYVRSVKRLKRWRRNARRLFRADFELKREILFRRLAQYHCAIILPPRLTRTANLIGARTLLELRVSRSLYARIDRHFETVCAAVEASDKARLAQSELWKARQSLQERFDEAVIEQNQFSATIKEELRTVFVQAYAALLKDLAVAGTFEAPRSRFRHSKASHA